MLDEILKVTRVPLQLEVVKMKNVGNSSVKEVRVVRDNDGGTSSKGGEIVDQPVNVKNIQVVGRLVEQEDLGLEENSSGKSKLHLPTARKRTNGVLLLDFVETDRFESGLNFLRGGEQSLVTQNPVKNGDLSLGTVDVVLNVESSNFGGGREALNLIVDDGVHEGRFPGTVTTTETISVASLKTHVGVVEQDLCTVSQVELLNVTEVLAFFFIRELGVVGLSFVSLLLEELSNSGERVVGRKSKLEVRRES